MVADIVNGFFECIGGIMMFLNCYKIWKDKQVKGVSIFATGFFTAWGYWNLYYYPSLNQWMSFVGGLFIVLGNTIWVSLAMYYMRKNKKTEEDLKTS